MNIVLVTAGELPSIGGKEIVVHYLAKTFLELGHRVRVVGPGGFWTKRNVKFPYPVHRWPTLKGYFQDQVNFVRILLDLGIFGGDVLHAHSTYFPGFASCQVKKIRKIPVVLTPHGEDIQVIPELGHGLRLNPRLKPKIEYAVRNADILTAISSNVRESLLDAGADERKVVLIPNGTDSERWKKNTGVDFHRWLNIPRDVKVILSVGNYRRCKGYETLLEAFRNIVVNHPKTRLVIAGRDDKRELLNQVNDLGLQEKVVLTGLIPIPNKVLGIEFGNEMGKGEGDLLGALYQNADIYVSAGVSDGAEGLSLAVLDAIAAGLPVVATSISGNMDIVKHGKSGILVEPGRVSQLIESIRYLLNNSEVAMKYGEAAYEVSQSYHWESVAGQYLDAYQRSIAALAKNM